MMKKISILMAGVALMGFMTSCEQDTDPRYRPVDGETAFVLNTPALANQLYELNADGVLDLTWSQPEWGFAAAPDYKVQISFSPVFQYLDADSTVMNFYTMPTTYHACAVSVPMSEIAAAMCSLRGITDAADYTQEPPREVYVRILANVPQIADSWISSNVITLKHVLGYCEIFGPGKIYIVGSFAGNSWNEPSADHADAYRNWTLDEADDAIGSNIFYGSYNIYSDTYFRFYTALTGWDADSYGSQADDSGLTFEMSNNQFKYTLVKGKGSFVLSNATGEAYKMTVNMNTNEFVMVGE